jgi:hypothetical protein
MTELYIATALPFYWLGQIAMLAYQEGLPPFGSTSRNNLKAEVRFHVVKRLLRQVRKFLRNQDASTTLYWHELMQLHLHPWQQDDSQEGEEGLLDFFADPS